MKFVCFLGVVLLAFCAQHVEALSLSGGFSSNFLLGGSDSTVPEALSRLNGFSSISSILDGTDSTVPEVTKCDRKEITSADWEKVLKEEQCDFEGAQCTKEIQDTKEAIRNCLDKMDGKFQKELACNLNALREFVTFWGFNSRKCWWKSKLGPEFKGTRSNGCKDILTRLIPVDLRPLIQGTDFPNYGFPEKLAATRVLEKVCRPKDKKKFGDVLAKLDDEVELTKVFVDMLIPDYIKSKDTKDMIEGLKERGISTAARENRWTKFGKTLNEDDSDKKACVAKDLDGKKREVYEKLRKTAEKLGKVKCEKDYLPRVEYKPATETNEGMVVSSYFAAPKQQGMTANSAPSQSTGGSNRAPVSGGWQNGRRGAPSRSGGGNNFAPR